MADENAPAPAPATPSAADEATPLTWERTPVGQPTSAVAPAKEIVIERAEREPGAPPERTAGQEYASLAREKKKLAAREREVNSREYLGMSDERRAQVHQQAQVQTFVHDALQHVRDNADAYPLLNKFGQPQRVLLVQQEWARRYGEALPHDAAARVAEQDLQDAARMILSDRGLVERLSRPAPQPGVNPQSVNWGDQRQLNEAERLRRARAAWDAAVARRRGGK